MTRFVVGDDRSQSTLFPERIRGDELLNRVMIPTDSLAASCSPVRQTGLPSDFSTQSCQLAFLNNKNRLPQR
jgi:hypothetical protein